MSKRTAVEDMLVFMFLKKNDLHSLSKLVLNPNNMTFVYIKMVSKPQITTRILSVAVHGRVD